MKILYRRKPGSYFLFGVKFKLLFKKIGIVLLTSAVLLLFLVGCSSPAAPASTSPGLLTDQAGRTVTLKNIPQRIVSLSPANTEILFALGLGDKVVGVTSYDDYPPEAKTKPVIGGFSTPNMEAVVAANPDLILASNIHIKNKIIPQMEARGLNVIVLDPKNIDDILTAITLVGKVTGKDTAAKSLVSDMQKRINAVVQKVSLSSNKPSVCFFVWDNPITIAGTATFHDELISKAGGANIINTIGSQSGYPTISLESFIAANPAIIIAGVGMGDGGDRTYQFVKTEPRLKDVDAVKNNRIFSIDQNVASHGGPRIVDALEAFAKDIHPEMYK
jgi:iron complex transport system substrate-binding protein